MEIKKKILRITLIFQR